MRPGSNSEAAAAPRYTESGHVSRGTGRVGCRARRPGRPRGRWLAHDDDTPVSAQSDV